MPKANPLLEKVYKLAEDKGYNKETVNKTIVSKGYDLTNFTNEAYETIYKGFYALQDKSALA